jgi:hypothetical protein
MITLKHLLTEQTSATKFCKQLVLSKPEFSADKWKSIGIWSKRNIAGTNTPSQHSMGNAIDWHGKKGTGDPVMQKLANWLVKNADIIQAQNIIYNRKIWNPSQGWHAYSGVSPHTDHVHVDFKSKSSLSNSTKKQHNASIESAINDIRYVTEKKPEDYFSKFKSWNPLSKGVGDDEEGAAAYFESLFTQLVKTPVIDKISNKCSFEDSKNITVFQDACTAIHKAILDGDSVSISFPFDKWNSSTNTYTKQTKTLNWDYM